MTVACRTCWIGAIILSVIAPVRPAGAQRPQFPPNYGAPVSDYAGATLPPIDNGSAVSLGPGIQPFDPYATPMVPSGLPPAMEAPPGFGAPAYGAPGYGAPATPYMPPAPPATWPAPGLTNPAAPYSPGPTGVSPYGVNPYAANPYAANPYGAPVASGPPYRRLFQDTGIRHTWLAGSTGDEMQINDTEVSTTAFFPNFLRGAGPLRVTPGFVFHFLDGPSGPVMSDMPPQLYSAYLDFGWAPEFSPTFGADVSFRTGVYSDFDAVTTDSIRFMGTGLGVVRVTPTTSFKFGVTYIDRNDIKLLPAGGILWQPNPQTRWDILFPSPKLAKYWTTVGNSQLWWYLGAEYGGGAWTMNRAEEPDADAVERVDINDIRVFLGLEWNNLNRWYGFIEGGYVFNRELVYVVVPSDSVELANTWMLRGGIAF